MAVDYPYISGQADSIIVSMASQDDGTIAQVNPTIAAGDFKIWNSGTSAWDNLATTPIALSAAGPAVRVSWSAAEASYDPFVIWGHDAAGAEWCDITIAPRLAAVGVGELAAGAIDSDTLATSAVTELSAGNWNYTSRTLTSFGTLAADVWNRLTSALTTSGSIGKALADLLAVFNATTRTLTQSAASVTAAVAGSDMAVTRYTTYTTQITGMTIPADWEKIWLTAKPDDAGSDTDAQIQILETNPGAATDGGQYFNRVAANVTTRPYASLTVDQPGGTITVLIKPAGTALLAEGSYKYDLKYLRSDADDTIDQLTGEANFTVTSSYTVAIS